MKKIVTVCMFLSVFLFASSYADTVMLTDNHGGTWSDAEKSPSNTEDDNMCWAAAASNTLLWTGWNQASGLYSEDGIFQYYQDHWTDDGCVVEYGWRWWFDGVNEAQGWDYDPPWSQVDVPGGNFYPLYPFYDYYHWNRIPVAAMTTISNYLYSGYGTAISIFGPGAHVLTVWGYDKDPNELHGYNGIWVTDSSDDRGIENAPDALRYYEVVFDDTKFSTGQWYIQDYYNFEDGTFTSDDWYIGGVYGLERNPDYVVIGDFNNDGVLNLLDVYGFKTALVNVDNWESESGLDAIKLGDFNGDGMFNPLDIAGFKQELFKLENEF